MVQPKILIATPVYGNAEAGSVSVSYHQSLLSMARSGQIEIAPAMSWLSEDLVRVRCRCLRHFLQETDCTHLLFWDADVGGTDSTGQGACCALALMGMLSENVDLIGAPYPRKRIYWDQVRLHGPEGAYSWPMRRLDPGSEVPFEGRKARVAGIPFGFCLISRACAQAVSDRCDTFIDWYDDKHHVTPLAFQLLVTSDRYRQLLSEDNSFCQRAIDAGREVWMYVGPGAPLDHVGSMIFKGDSKGLIGSR